MVNNALNKSDIFYYKSVFQKTGLIIIMFGRNFFMRFAMDLAARVGNYPILKVADLLATLGGEDKFTKLDKTQAYQQVQLEAESKQYTTINTHKGLFQYNRFPYGVSSAPAIFQRNMENLLYNIPYVIVRVGDILVSGANDNDHLRNLEEVLKRLAKAGLRLKKGKCVFMESQVT